MRAFIFAVSVSAALVACGGGGDGNEDGVNNDDAPKAPTTETVAGSGSTIASATVSSGTILYQQYYRGPSELEVNQWLPKPGVPMPTVSSSVVFNNANGAGSIQFSLFEKDQKIETNNRYATASWTGPLGTGGVFLDGNALIGCDLSTDQPIERTQVFVSTSLPRITNMVDIDDIFGKSFGVYECGADGVTRLSDLKINSNGTSSWDLFSSGGASTAVFSLDQLITLLQTNTYGGGVNLNGTFVDNGRASGHLYRYVKSGVMRHAMVIRSYRSVPSEKVSDYLLVQQN